MKTKIFALLIISVLLISSKSKDTLNYSHKTLLKSIKKEITKNDFKLVEQEVPADIKIINTCKYFRITKSNSNTAGYTYVGRLPCCRVDGCDNPTSPQDSTSQVEYEYLDYFIVFDTTFTIKDITVFNYQATYGYQVAAKNWLKQFVGYSATLMNYENPKIDAISGATVSVDALKYDVIFQLDNVRRIFE